MNDNDEDILTEEEEFDLIPDISAATEENIRLFYRIMSAPYPEDEKNESKRNRERSSL